MVIPFQLSHRTEHAHSLSPLYHRFFVMCNINSSHERRDLFPWAAGSGGLKVVLYPVPPFLYRLDRFPFFNSLDSLATSLVLVSTVSDWRCLV